MRERISIIVPCYNCEKTLERCIDSLIGQTYEFFEIILVDDGSIDATGAICDRYEGENANIKVVHQENEGLVGAWKKGVSIATSDYVSFCDADDFFDNDFAEKVVDIVRKDDVDVIAFGLTISYDDGKIQLVGNKIAGGVYIGDDLQRVKENLLFSGGMRSQLLLNSRVAKVFRRELLQKCIPEISNELTNGEDAVTTYVSIMKSDKLFCFENYYPYHYMRNGESMIGKYDPDWYKKQVVVYNELNKIDDRYSLQQKWQIDNYFFSSIVLYAKKAISRNDNGYRSVKQDVSKVRSEELINAVLRNVDISGYKIGARVFVRLFLHKCYFLMYLLTKAATIIGVGRE